MIRDGGGAICRRYYAESQSLLRSGKTHDDTSNVRFRVSPRRPPGLSPSSLIHGRCHPSASIFLTIVGVSLSGQAPLRLPPIRHPWSALFWLLRNVGRNGVRRGGSVVQEQRAGGEALETSGTLGVPALWINAQNR